MQTASIAILDFGSQYTQLICRSITELGVKAEVLLPNVSPHDLQHYAGRVLSGGPASVYDTGAPVFSEDILDMQVPILGICYGLQLMAKLLHGDVRKSLRAEYGKAVLRIAGPSRLLRGLEESEVVWMSHGDQLVALPEGFKTLASTENCEFAAVANEQDPQVWSAVPP